MRWYFRSCDAQRCIGRWVAGSFWCETDTYVFDAQIKGIATQTPLLQVGPHVVQGAYEGKFHWCMH